MKYAVVFEQGPSSVGATVPDLPGCLSDGESREEAARNIADAIAAWIDEAKKLGREIPEPSLHLAMAGE